MALPKIDSVTINTHEGLGDYILDNMQVEANESEDAEAEKEEQESKLSNLSQKMLGLLHLIHGTLEKQLEEQKIEALNEARAREEEALERNRKLGLAAANDNADAIPVNDNEEDSKSSVGSIVQNILGTLFSKSFLTKLIGFLGMGLKMAFRILGRHPLAMAALLGVSVGTMYREEITTGLQKVINWVAEKAGHGPVYPNVSNSNVEPGSEEAYDNWSSRGDSSSSSSVADSIRDSVMNPVDAEMVQPVSSGRISSQFGEKRGNRTHQGTDYAVAVGTPVMAIRDGVVVRADNRDPNGYGLQVVIRHPDGTSSRYAHLSKFRVKPGDKVQAGQTIGLSGNTGRSSGPHLHFEVRKGMSKDGYGGKAINPQRYLNKAPVKVASAPAQPTKKPKTKTSVPSTTDFSVGAMLQQTFRHPRM